MKKYFPLLIIGAVAFWWFTKNSDSNKNEPYPNPDNSGVSGRKFLK